MYTIATRLTTTLRLIEMNFWPTTKYIENYNNNNRSNPITLHLYVCQTHKHTHSKTDTETFARSLPFSMILDRTSLVHIYLYICTIYACITCKQTYPNYSIYYIVYILIMISYSKTFFSLFFLTLDWFFAYSSLF